MSETFWLRLGKALLESTGLAGRPTVWVEELQWKRNKFRGRLGIGYDDKETIVNVEGVLKFTGRTVEKDNLYIPASFQIYDGRTGLDARTTIAAWLSDQGCSRPYDLHGKNRLNHQIEFCRMRELSKLEYCVLVDYAKHAGLR